MHAKPSSRLRALCAPDPIARFRFARGEFPRDNSRVRIHTLPAGPIETNAYLLTDSARGEALLIDAPAGVWDAVQPILAQAKCRVVALLITHGHWDHTGDAARIRKLGVPLHAHEADRILLEQPGVMAAYSIPGLHTEPSGIDRAVVPGQELVLAGRVIDVRHVPGHCPGNVLFYFSSMSAAFVGDALFNGSIGRTDLPGGDFAQLDHSIRTQIYTLPPDTAVHPGHGPATTVGDEINGNPYVSA